jgi:hypothetical protein
MLLVCRRNVELCYCLLPTLPQVRLTEEDTEYNIFVVKHVFESAVVCQFNCTNTVPEQVGQAYLLR